MIIRKMTASYGKLQGDSLELKPGLNIVTAPNESGKSTWCSFIKNMIYGIDSSAREKGGVKPDKTLFAPWSGSPMSGSMDIEHEGQEITLSRAGRESAPMRELAAVYTGTSQPADLRGDPGEALLGIPREVFERSAFIGQGGVAVSASPELEKRIAAIVQTGDESTSYTDAEERLRAAMRRRRHNKSGLLPDIERELVGHKEKLRSIESEETRGNQLKQAIKQAIEKRDGLTKQVAESREVQRKKTLEDLGASRSRVHTLENELEGLRTAAASAEQELRGSRFGTESPEAVREKAARDIKTVSALEEKAEKSSPRAWNILAFALAVLALACIIFAVLAPSLALTGILLVVFSPPAGYIPAIICGVLFLAIIANKVIISKKQKTLKAQIAEIFAAYGATDTEGLLAAVASYENACERLARLIERREKAQSRLDDEREHQAERDTDIVRGLDFAAADSGAGELTRRLEESDAALRRLREDLATHEGRLEAMGGREKLLERIDALAQEHKRLMLEYEALALAAETLKNAGIEIQNRLTPRLSARASEIFARLTEDRYEAVALDRELKAMARLIGDTLPRESSFLSAGALDQLYLAVRLAVCELALPEEGKNCPVILDDALGSFDDNRCAAALLFLKELAASRQIILFTCHGREAEIMKQYEDVHVINV